MIEHSEPRRWKLATTETLGREDRLLRDGVDSTFNDERVVWVREDTATKADVEAVCQILEADYPGIEERARALLSTIFKD